MSVRLTSAVFRTRSTKVAKSVSFCVRTDERPFEVVGTPRAKSTVSVHSSTTVAVEEESAELKPT